MPNWGIVRQNRSDRLNAPSIPISRLELFRACTILGLILVCTYLPQNVACAGEPCMVIKRKDILETWTIPAKSKLCNMTDKADSQYKYNLATEGGELYLVNKVLKEPLTSMYVSDKSTGFSVVVSRPGLTVPHIFTLNPTEDNSLLYRYQYSFDVKSAFRSTFHVKPEDITREGALFRPIYLLATLGITCLFGFFLITSAITIRFAVILNTSWFVGSIIALNFFQYENFQDFATLMGAVGGISILLGMLSYLIPGKWGTIIFGSISLIMHFLGAPSTIRSMILGMVITVSASLTIYTYTSLTCDKFTRVLCVIVFTLVSTQYFCIAAFYSLILPTEAYFRIMKGPSSYMAGTPGTKSSLVMPRFFMLLGAVGLGLFLIYSKFKKGAKITADSKEFL